MDVNALPLQLRALDAGGTLAKRLGLYTFRFQEQKMLARACAATGLTDFGDLGFLVPLRIMAASILGEAGLRYLGDVRERLWMIEILKRRLYIQRDLSAHPEILQTPVARPIFILGMPRSGTTLLQNLLLADSGARWLRPWEIEEPWPERGAADDPREQRFRRRVENSRSGNPEIDKIHAIDSPTDCDILFLPTFFANLQTISLHLPTYDRWLDERSEQEWVAPYTYYRQELQRLAWYQAGGHWVLKSPLHLGHIEALLHVFPDARVIHLHRDPRKTVPSTCSMVTEVRRQKKADIKPFQVGGFICQRLATRVVRAMAARESVPAAAEILDVAYPDLLRDPVGTVLSIYRHFGGEPDAGMIERMKEHLQQNPQHKRGVHRYSLADFGLDPAAVDHEFAAYRQRFGVGVE